jgi:oligopeptide transport system substrate-binding protein
VRTGGLGLMPDAPADGPAREQPTAGPDPAPPAGAPAWGQPAGGRRAAAVGTIVLIGLMAATALLGVVSVTPPGEPSPAARPEGVDAVIVGGAPVSWDPAAIGDATSASALAQVWEGLTALDTEARVQPALARRWRLEDGGRRLVFELRPGITFSDGTPITSRDVARSWLRVLDPQRPSPLSGLLTDIVGAREYAAGDGSATDVAIGASDGRVTLRFRRPASWFPAAAASPTLAVVPERLPSGIDGPGVPDDLVVSGAYVPSDDGERSIRLTANPRYWAGPPPLDAIELETGLGGASPVSAFESGAVDLVSIDADDATWIRYDRELGPALRRWDDFSVEYYGFDTSRPPFEDSLVRRAFAAAVDWDRLVALAAGVEPATSLVPPGIEGRGDIDFSPAYDPDAARAALADAGYPEGSGFPAVTLTTSGTLFDEGVAAGLRSTLGVEVALEVMPFDAYSERLDTDPPAFWALEWVADYPHAQDFLGLLLETGSISNVGGWSDAAYDAAIEAAASTDDAGEQQAAYVEAQRIVADEAPVVPVRYGESWALTRDGLSGAGRSGVDVVRFAGLAWADR